MVEGVPEASGAMNGIEVVKPSLNSGFERLFNNSSSPTPTSPASPANSRKENGDAQSPAVNDEQDEAIINGHSDVVDSSPEDNGTYNGLEENKSEDTDAVEQKQDDSHRSETDKVGNTSEVSTEVEKSVDNASEIHSDNAEINVDAKEVGEIEDKKAVKTSQEETSEAQDKKNVENREAEQMEVTAEKSEEGKADKISEVDKVGIVNEVAKEDLKSDSERAKDDTPSENKKIELTPKDVGKNVDNDKAERNNKVEEKNTVEETTTTNKDASTASSTTMAASSLTISISNKSSTPPFVDESVQDEEDCSKNLISLEPVDSNNTDDEDEDDSGSPPALETVSPSAARTAKATKHDKSTMEVTTIDDDDNDSWDFDQALREINKITDTSKSIMEAGDSNRKRVLPSSSAQANKKPKRDNANAEVKKHLKDMSRKQLEDIICQQMVNMTLNKGEVGALRKKVDILKEDVDFWKRRCDCQGKQLKDLSTVMTKYIVDSKSKPQSKGPMRITRSVGLQVKTGPQLRTDKRPCTVQGSPRAAASAQSVTSSRTVQVNGRPGQIVGPAAPIPTATAAHVISPGVRQAVQLATPSHPVQSIPPIPPPINHARQQASAKATAPPASAKPQPELVELDSDDETPPPPVPVARPAPQAPFRAVQAVRVLPAKVARLSLTHPAPLPEFQPPRHVQGMKKVPPKPKLTINKSQEGVVLSWNMGHNLLEHATIMSYQIFAYQEMAGATISANLWKKVGDVKALPLPMACTLKQFTSHNRYHFAVRACDTFKRNGEFSMPASISI